MSNTISHYCECRNEKPASKYATDLILSHLTGTSQQISISSFDLHNPQRVFSRSYQWLGGYHLIKHLRNRTWSQTFTSPVSLSSHSTSSLFWFQVLTKPPYTFNLEFFLLYRFNWACTKPNTCSEILATQSLHEVSTDARAKYYCICEQYHQIDCYRNPEAIPHPPAPLLAHTH